MNESEITQRVIGILTETSGWYPKLQADPDRKDIEDQGAALVGEFVAEVFHTDIAVTASASPQDVANALMESLSPRLFRVLATCSWAFAELAHLHDTGRTDISSADLLQNIALRNAES